MGWHCSSPKREAAGLPAHAHALEGRGLGIARGDGAHDDVAVLEYLEVSEGLGVALLGQPRLPACRRLAALAAADEARAAREALSDETLQRGRVSADEGGRLAPRRAATAAAAAAGERAAIVPEPARYRDVSEE
eukprot:scaffold48941_cov36-Phaeocystis_antarctica.AAC.1